MSHLVIVESPSKSKTISKYLSDDFVVKSWKRKYYGKKNRSLLWKLKE